MKLRSTPPASIPGPPPIPLLGSTGSLLRFFGDPIRCMRTIYAEHGPVAAVSRNDASLVCAFGPEYNRQVLSNPAQFHNSAELPIRVPEGSSLHRLTRVLVGMNGDQHRRVRKVMTPLFQKGYLQHYRDDIVAVTKRQLERWRKEETLDVSAEMAELSLCVAFRCLFGMDAYTEARDLAKLALSFTHDFTSPKLIVLPFDVPGMPYRSFMGLCNKLEGRLVELIRQRRSEVSERRDAFSTMIGAKDEDGAPLPESTLIGLANELFLASHDTTARTLTWTLFLLDQHPEVLHRLVDELTGSLGGEAPTLEQLESLPLLDAVVKESQRLLPATPFLFFRQSTQEFQLGPYTLPAGTSLVISPFMTHRLPDLYPEPTRFKPDRWLGAPQRSPYEYLPFAAGPRVCIGISFASLNLRLVLAMLLQRHRLTMPSGTDVSYHVRGPIMGLKKGLPMRVGPPTDRALTRPAVRGTINELVQFS